MGHVLQRRCWILQILKPYIVSTRTVRYERLQAQTERPYNAVQAWCVGMMMPLTRCRYTNTLTTHYG
ncbi:MAG: hypothetical protein VXY62_10945, partial [Pseudomonadota bacterium]|nr:hypothetical protein [Pseudomonadota bacterium]